MAKFSTWFRHFIANLVVTRPAMVDRYVWLRMTDRAAELLNAKFDIKAPRKFRIAKDDYEWKRWDFFNAAKYFFNFKAETVAAIYACWFKKPGFDPKFKPAVLLNLWLTVPTFVFVPAGLSDERKETKIKEMQAKIDEVIGVIGESNPDLTADMLQNMSVAGAVQFLEKTNAPPLLMVMRKIMPFDVTIKLLNALRQKNPDRFMFWLQRFPIDDVAKIKVKHLEIDRMAIEEYRLKNEIMKFKNGELAHETEPYKQEAERVRFENEKMKFEAMVDRRKRGKEGEGSIEEQQRERQANLEKSVADLARTLADIIRQYRQEDAEEKPAKAAQSAEGKGG